MYVVCGGPSVTQADVDRLAGRKVVVINTSFQRAPWADFLFFADARWWGEHRRQVSAEFKGRIVSATGAAGRYDRVLMLEKIKPPPALSLKPHQVAMNRTSLAGAINLAVHLGAVRIVLLGADMQAINGRTHHYAAPHKWPVKPGCWKDQMAEMRAMAAPLDARRIEVINASPLSLINWWPKRALAEIL